jgi:hypothetical protein
MDMPEVALDSSSDRPVRNPQRSKIANGAALATGDGRSAWARRAREIVGDHIGDLGGIDNCSSSEVSLCRRGAALTIELERLEVKFSQSENGASNLDLEVYQRTVNSLRRIFECLGLQRRPRDTTLIDARAEEIGLAARNEQRRRHIEAMHSVLAGQAGTTVRYGDR